MVDRDTETPVFTDSLGAGHVLALVLGAGSNAGRLFRGVALKALALTRQRLEEIDRAGCAGGKTSFGVGPGHAFGAALVLDLGPGLEGVEVIVALDAGLEAIEGWLSGIGVVGALETGHKSAWGVGTEAANRDAVTFVLGAFIGRPGSSGARLARSHSGFVLVSALGAESAGLLTLASKETSWAFQTSKKR